MPTPIGCLSDESSSSNGKTKLPSARVFPAVHRAQQVVPDEPADQPDDEGGGSAAALAVQPSGSCEAAVVAEVELEQPPRPENR